MLVLEWLYNENAEVKADHPRAYDTPPMRFGEISIFPRCVPPSNLT